MTVWCMHTLVENETLFLEQGIICIGWPALGDLSKIEPSREAFKAAYRRQAKSNETPKRIGICAGMLYRFVCEMQEGDYIVLPSKHDRKINIGQIAGPYYFDISAEHNEDYRAPVNRRKVVWLKKSLPRSAFSAGALYEASAQLILSTIKTYADEFIRSINADLAKTAASSDKGDSDSDKEDPQVQPDADSIEELTKDFILKTLSRKLKGYDLEPFVADLLQAMGYRTTVSQKGGDSGIDIIAYKDELPPRIVVQVKSHDNDVQEAALQALRGAMREGDYGLFVTLSDYTANARKYLRNNPIIRGINGNDLAELILKYYELLDSQYRSMLPLRKVYVPEAEEE